MKWKEDKRKIKKIKKFFKKKLIFNNSKFINLFMHKYYDKSGNIWASHGAPIVVQGVGAGIGYQ